MIPKRDVNKGSIESKKMHEDGQINEVEEKQPSKQQPAEEQVTCISSLDRGSGEMSEDEQQLKVSEKTSEGDESVQRSKDEDHQHDKIEHCDEERNLIPQEEEIDELDFSKLKENNIFLGNSECSMEGDEDDLFHDVGQTNSLNALSLPNTLTKDRTPAEVVQLLRSLGDLPRFNRSNSFSHSYSMAHRHKNPRRFSLGAIPEGKIVTSYSDDEQSTSQLLDTQFLESLIVNLEGGGRQDNDSIRRVGTHGVHDDDEELFDSASDESETLSCTSSSNSTSDESPEVDDFIEVPHSDLPTVAITQDNMPPQITCPQSLKVVNLAWNPLLNTVQSHISEYPLSPPDFSNKGGRCTPTHKLPPTNKKPNPYVQSRSPSSSQASVRLQSGVNVRTSAQIPPNHSVMVDTPSPLFLSSPLHSPESSHRGDSAVSMNAVEIEVSETHVCML